MTPSARYAASISILDKIIAGAPAERELTIWARGNRFAGSKDRAAIRDLVYDSLRNLRSYEHFSGLSGARGVFVGRLISKNEEIESIFNGQGYGPVCLTDIEKNTVNTKKNDMPYAVQMDIPDWLSEKFGNIHNYNILKSRAPIDLRVNIKKISLKSAISELKKDNIETEKLNLVDTALRVKGETRKIPQTKLYLNGLIELQDAGSQALVAQLDCPKNGKVLDYCAGGGHSINIPCINAFDDQDEFHILQIDAHLDFVDERHGVRYGHGNPMRRAAEKKYVRGISQFGIRNVSSTAKSGYEDAKKLGSDILSVRQFRKIGPHAAAKRIPKGRVYVTIDIDAFCPSIAPGTGTPSHGGFLYYDVLELLQELSKNNEVIGIDLVEVAPAYDQTDSTSILAAQILLNFLGFIFHERSNLKK
jgi:arginase family enzyme